MFVLSKTLGLLTEPLVYVAAILLLSVISLFFSARLSRAGLESTRIFKPPKTEQSVVIGRCDQGFGVECAWRYGWRA